MFSHQNFVDYVNFLNVAMQPLYFWYMCPSKYHNNHSCMEIQLSWRIIWEQNWGYLKTLNLLLLRSHILNILLADWFDIVGWTGQNWTGLFLDVHTAPLALTPVIFGSRPTHQSPPRRVLHFRFTFLNVEKAENFLLSC